MNPVTKARVAATGGAEREQRLDGAKSKLSGRAPCRAGQRSRAKSGVLLQTKALWRSARAAHAVGHTTSATKVNSAASPGRVARVAPRSGNAERDAPKGGCGGIGRSEWKWR